MPAAQYDFELEQGTDHTMEFRWKDSEGVPVDLSGYTARMQMRASTSAPEVLDDLTTENGRITLGGADGMIALEFPNEVTAAYAFKRAKHDLELISPGGVVTRLVQGVVTVSREVTRSV